MEEYKAAGGDTGSYEPLPRTDNDVEFELENRYAAMLKRKRQFEDENARMRVQMADLTTRLEHLQENHDALLVSLEDAQDKINKPDADTEREIKRYEDQIRERDDLIESQEGALEANRQEQQKLRKELDSIRDAAARTIAAEDELKEVRLETLELTKKANTVDRFKQKLEAQKALETDLKNVEYENEELRSQLRDYNKMKQRLLQLEDTHKLFQNSIAKAEMEIFEIAGQKRAIDDERVQLQRELAAAEDKIAQAEQRVVDLEEERFLRSATGPGDSLADELQSEDAHRQNAHEVSRLRAEIALLKGNSFAAQESDRLRAQLEEAEAFRKVVEAKYRDVFEKEAISQQQLRLMMSSVEDNTKFVELAMSIGRLTSLTPEHYRHQAFIDLKLAHAQLTQDLAALQKGYEIIDADYQETRRSLLEAESDLNLIEKDDIDQLAEFKATQESLAESLKSELTALKKKKRALEIDYELQRTHLQESIIANAKLSGALEDSPSTKESADVSHADSTGSRRGFDLGGEESRTRSIFIPDWIINANCGEEVVKTTPNIHGVQSPTPPQSPRSASTCSAIRPSTALSNRQSSFLPPFLEPCVQQLAVSSVPAPSPSLDKEDERPVTRFYPTLAPAYNQDLGHSLTSPSTGPVTAASVSSDEGGDRSAQGTTTHSCFSTLDSFSDLPSDIVVAVAESGMPSPLDLSAAIGGQVKYEPGPFTAGLEAIKMQGDRLESDHIQRELVKMAKRRKDVR